MPQLTLVNLLYIHNMQLPASRSSDTRPSIFQTILEECSSKQIEIEEISEQPPQNLLPAQELFKEQAPHSPNIWFRMDEVPCENILDEQELAKEDANLQYHKIKSLREEQQTKLALFLRDDKYKSLRKIEIPLKHTSSTEKPSLSLSPRKTKKIDKSKGLKFFPQSE